MRITLGVMKVNLLLVLLFALVFNWPIFLHFYRILTALEHVKAGFALSIPLVLIAALNAVFLPFTFRYLLKPFFTFLIVTASLVSYAMLKYGMDDLRAFFDGDLRWLKHYGFSSLDVPTLSGGVGA